MKRDDADAHATLSASVGSASKPVRALLSVFFTAAALLLSWCVLTLLQAGDVAAVAIAALFLQPFVAVSAVAAVFVAVPHSRFGRFVARPNSGWVLLVWGAGALATCALRLLF